ncbi:MAG TPA: hypothetical protein DCL77_14065, partial [Prolixibacteraceae bacterium]|nr:hypothetical protein [Prolixibacteraceae bacterium]
GVSEGEGTAVFKSKLVPAFGATLKVVDINGNESTLTNLVPGDKVLVTSADGTQTTTYFIDIKTEVDRGDIASAISMVPNPSTGKVVVHGLAKGDRLRVLNPVGTVLFDVIAVSSAETISLDAQPAGIYLFVVSAGSQPLNIKKIMKK